MRLGGVAAVAAATKLGSLLDPLAGLYGNAAAPEKRQKGVLAVAEVEHDMIASGVPRIRLADRLIRQTVG